MYVKFTFIDKGVCFEDISRAVIFVFLNQNILFWHFFKMQV